MPQRKPSSWLTPANRDLSNLGVTTTNHERFSGEEHALMAALIWKRFGYDTTVAAAAWRRLLENSCGDPEFEALAQCGVNNYLPTHL
jgi:hypothetical protein